MSLFSRKPKTPKPLKLLRVLVASPEIRQTTEGTLGEVIYRFEHDSAPTINMSFTLGWRDDFVYTQRTGDDMQVIPLRTGPLLGVQFCGDKINEIIAAVADRLAKGGPEAAIRQMSSLMEYVRQDFRTRTS